MYKKLLSLLLTFAISVQFLGVAALALDEPVFDTEPADEIVEVAAEAATEPEAEEPVSEEAAPVPEEAPEDAEEPDALAIDEAPVEETPAEVPEDVPDELPAYDAASDLDVSRISVSVYKNPAGYASGMLLLSVDDPDGVLNYDSICLLDAKTPDVYDCIYGYSTWYWDNGTDVQVYRFEYQNEDAGKSYIPCYIDDSSYPYTYVQIGSPITLAKMQTGFKASADVTGSYGSVKIDIVPGVSLENDPYSIPYLVTFTDSGNQITYFSTSFDSYNTTTVAKLAPGSYKYTIQIGRSYAEDTSALLCPVISGSVTVSEDKIVDLTKSIPDTALQSLIQQELAYTESTLEKAYMSDLMSITSLYSYNGSIRDLTGIDVLAGLQSLTLSGHQITDASPLCTMTGLTSINLSNNQLTVLNDFSKLVNLRSLGLTGNLIPKSEFVASKLPASLLKNDSTWLEYTPENQSVPFKAWSIDKYYAVSANQFPFFVAVVGYNRGGDVTLEATINGKSYTASDYISTYGSSEDFLVIPDVAVAPGTYDVSWTLKDDSDTVVATQPATKVTFDGTQKERATYINTNASYVSMSLQLDQSETDQLGSLESAEILSGSTVVGRTEIDSNSNGYLSSYTTSLREDRYNSYFENTPYFDIKVTDIYGYIYTSRYLKNGSYALRLNGSKGSITLENYFKVSANAILSEVYLNSSQYDGEGKYIYFIAQGSNLEEGKFHLEFTDSNGNKPLKYVSTVADYSSISGTAVCLKYEVLPEWRNQTMKLTWSISTSSGYDLIDTCTSHSLNVDTSKIMVHPTVYYNYKTKTLEFTYSSDITDPIILSIYADRAAQENHLTPLMSATATPANDLCTIKLTDAQVKQFFTPLRTSWEYPVIVSSVNHYESWVNYIQTYNYYDSGSTPTESQLNINSIPTTVKELSFSAYRLSASTKYTLNVDDTLSSTFTTNGSGYYSGLVKLTSSLSVGTHKATVTNSKGESKASCYFTVFDPSVFNVNQEYMDYSQGNYYVYLRSPAIEYASNNGEVLYKDKDKSKFKIEAFDMQGNSLGDVPITKLETEWSYVLLYFDRIGALAEVPAAYFRITYNGEIGYNPDANDYFYASDMYASHSVELGKLHQFNESRSVYSFYSQADDTLATNGLSEIHNEDGLPIKGTLQIFSLAGTVPVKSISVNTSKNYYEFTTADLKGLTLISSGKATSRPYRIVFVDSNGKTQAVSEGYLGSHVSQPADPASIADAEVTVADAAYTGSAVTPEVTVTLNGVTLSKDTDYTVTYSNNTAAGSAAKVTVTGKGNYKGTKTVTFTITAAALDGYTVTLTPTSYTYTGSALKPTVKVTTPTGSTLSSTNYTVAYENNINAGTAKVVITGKGNLEGTLESSFVIAPKALAATAVTASNVAFNINGTPNPTVVVKDGSKVLTEGTDYSVTYPEVTAVGPTEVIVNGLGNYGFEISKAYSVVPAKMADAEVTFLGEYTYTGKPVIPEMKVNLGGVDLVQGTDYKITLASNTNASSAAAVTIAGIGNYASAGSVKKTFTIKPADISAAVLDVGSMVYTGKELKPAINSVYLGDVKLTTSDYTVAYENNINAGTAKVVITGKGNLEGTLESSFVIAPKALAATAVTASNVTFNINGTPNPTVVVKDGSKVLTEGTDYSVTYPEVTTVGPAEVIVNGLGNYGFEISKAYSVVPAKMADAEVTFLGEYTYTGKPVIPEMKVNLGGVDLVQGTDYKITLASNTNASSAAAVTIAGIGNYASAGSVKKTFTIKPADISAAVLDVKSMVYTGKELKPAINSVYFGDVKLTTSNYTVSGYANNINVPAEGTSEQPSVTITGKGNFVGTATGTFEITPMPVTKLTVTVGSVGYMGATETADPTVTVKNGSTVLTAGEDYLVEDPESVIIGTNYVNIIGLGNFEGTAAKKYTVTKPSVADAEIEVLDPVLTFTGKALTPAVRVTFKGEELTLNSEYTVTYKNNTKVPTTSALPTITVNGKGSYIGSKTATFTIQPRDLSSLPQEEYTVKHIAKLNYSPANLTGTTTVTVKDIAGKNVTLKAKTDYVLVFDDENYNVGEDHTFTVQGCGNYTGSLTGTCTVVSKAISNTVVTLNPTSIVYKADSEAILRPEVTIVDKQVPSVALVEGVDYTLTFTNDNKKGTATIAVTGMGNYTGTLKKTYSIVAANVADYVDVKLDQNEFVYSGSANTPKVTVTDRDGNVLVEKVDYTVSYLRNVNVPTKEGDNYKPAVKITGKGNYTGTKTVTFTIVPADLNSFVTVVSDVTKEGAKPTISLYDANGKKLPTSAYTVLLHKDEAVTLIGKGNYTGTVARSFHIASKLITASKTVSTINLMDGDTEAVFQPEQLKVMFGSTRLDADEYTVTYLNNDKAGTAIAIISPTDETEDDFQHRVMGGPAVLTFKVVDKRTVG